MEFKNTERSFVIKCVIVSQSQQIVKCNNTFNNKNYEFNYKRFLQRNYGTYFDRSTLKKHNYVHIGNPYQCSSCARTFDRRDKMNIHMQKMHVAAKVNDNEENDDQSLPYLGPNDLMIDFCTSNGVKYDSGDIVVLASLLDPRFQNLLDVKHYLQSIKLSAVDFLVKCVSDIGTDGISSSPNTSLGNTSKSESFIDELAEKHSTLASVARTSTSQTALERECYLLLSMHNKIKVTNVLTFWKDHARLMPSLSSVAAQIYGIPATSTPSERNFNVSGLVVNQRRTQITPDNLDKVIFMHSNYDFVKKVVAHIELKE